MKLKKFTPKKNRAQAMVEFAIALPILLMLLYGILEAGDCCSCIPRLSLPADRQSVTALQQVSAPAAFPAIRIAPEFAHAANRADFLKCF